MKVAKLTKLKSALKKWPSFTKLDRTISSSSSVTAADDGAATGAGNLRPVYVGKSRRLYLVSTEVIDHPLFQVLVDKSNGSDGITVACEVVLFDHLLWMLENAGADVASVDELVEFYSY
ncbi:hypothetical protein ACSBR2_043126 [Camellia fascicularis]